MRPKTLTFALLFWGVALFAQNSSDAGLIDARSFDFAQDRFSLEGTWYWFDSRLLSPSEVSYERGVPARFPSTWNATRTNHEGTGYATYQVKLLLPANVESYGLKIPQIYSSYNLFIGNELIASNGKPGRTQAETKPQWDPQIVQLPDADTLTITLQISNFSHSTGGCKEPFHVGRISVLEKSQSLAEISNLVEATLLMLIGFGFLIVFIRYAKRVIVYFSILCISWSVRALFSNDYLVINWFPDFDWVTMVRIEYITLFLTMIFAILFLYRLFSNEGNQIVKYLLVTVNSGFIIYTVLADPMNFTVLLPVYLGAAGVLLVYGAIVVLTALVNERTGATLLTISVMMGLAMFSYDIFTYEGWFTYNTLFFSLGYLIIFGLLGTALLIHLEIIKSTDTATTMLTYRDLYEEHK